MAGYANLGSTLQALVIEQITGLKLAEYMRIHIFEPLGMTGTKFFYEMASDNYATICFPPNARALGEPYGVSGLASGDLVVTLGDMSKFL